jgi:hypothetical protein
MKKKKVTAFSKHFGKAYHISQRYKYKWINNVSKNIINDTDKFKNELINQNDKQNQNQIDQMYNCTDKDDTGMTCFLAHTIDNADVSINLVTLVSLIYLIFNFLIHVDSSTN